MNAMKRLVDFLRKHPRSTKKEVAEGLDLSIGGAFSALKRAVEQGYAVCDKSDRQHRWSATDKDVTKKAAAAAGGRSKRRGAGGMYPPEALIRAFRMAAAFRDKMVAAGLTDNAGAIHSAERILEVLGLRLKYPGLGHSNSLREYPGAEFSDAAKRARAQGEKVYIKHVTPPRDFTCRAIEKISGGATDRQLKNYIRKHYRLVILTKGEARRLDKINQTGIRENQLEKAGIKLAR